MKTTSSHSLHSIYNSTNTMKGTRKYYCICIEIGLCKVASPTSSSRAYTGNQVKGLQRDALVSSVASHTHV